MFKSEMLITYEIPSEFHGKQQHEFKYIEYFYCINISCMIYSNINIVNTKCSKFF